PGLGVARGRDLVGDAGGDEDESQAHASIRPQAGRPPLRWAPMPVTPCARLLLAAVLLVSCARFTASAKPEPSEPPATHGPSLLLRGATVLTAAGPAIGRGDVLVADGRISEVGTGLSAPVGVQIVDVTGSWLTPGIIDPHSHLGVYAVPNVATNADGNEMTGPFKPEVRA